MAREAELRAIVNPEVDDRALEREAQQVEESMGQAATLTPDIDMNDLQRRIESELPGGDILGDVFGGTTGGIGGGGGGPVGGQSLTEIAVAQLETQQDIHDELEQLGASGGLASGPSQNGLPGNILAGLVGGGGSAGLAGLLSAGAIVGTGALAGGVFGKAGQNFLQGKFPDAFSDSENIIPGTSVTMSDDVEAVLNDLSVPEPTWIADLTFPEPDWLDRLTPDDPTDDSDSDDSSSNDNADPRKPGPPGPDPRDEINQLNDDEPGVDPSEVESQGNRPNRLGDSQPGVDPSQVLSQGRRTDPDRNPGEADLIARNRANPTDPDRNPGEADLIARNRPTVSQNRAKDAQQRRQPTAEVNVTVNQQGLSQRELERKLDEATEQAKDEAKEELRRELSGGRTGI